MVKQTLTPQTWIEAGLEQLVKEGPQALRAEPLARYLKTTKGSFYWHFKDVPAFHETLLEHWKQLALADLQALDGAGGTVAERLIAFGQSVQRNAADAALRAWGQSDPSVMAVVSDVDQARLEELSRLMRKLGNSNQDFARAAYGALIGLKQTSFDDSDALVAFASLIDVVVS